MNCCHAVLLGVPSSTKYKCMNCDRAFSMKKIKPNTGDKWKMAEGQGCDVCNSEHDGNFYRFCKCTCHDRVARHIVGWNNT